jgi:hypothetical protein
MRLSSSHSRYLSAAFAAMAIGVAFHAAHAPLGLGGHGVDSFTKAWVYTGIELIAVAVCASRVMRKRDDRAAWALVTFGLLTWTGGDLLWTVCGWATCRIRRSRRSPTGSISPGIPLCMWR